MRDPGRAGGRGFHRTVRRAGFVLWDADRLLCGAGFVPCCAGPPARTSTHRDTHVPFVTCGTSHRRRAVAFISSHQPSPTGVPMTMTPQLPPTDTVVSARGLLIPLRSAARPTRGRNTTCQPGSQRRGVVPRTVGRHAGCSGAPRPPGSRTLCGGGRDLRPRHDPAPLTCGPFHRAGPTGSPVAPWVPMS